MATTESTEYDHKSTSEPHQAEVAGNSKEIAFAPQSFKFYQLIKPIGEGGFGQVFEAWDTKLMRTVAIKRVKNLGSNQTTQSLLKEARMAASLHHPAFVKIHAIEDDVADPAIIMELVPGQTLKEWIRDHADTPRSEKLPEIIEIIAQITEAMQAAHDSKLIHGDIKPSNLILEPSGKVRILDFGLAVKADLQATTSISQSDPQGTIAYMAPEILAGHAPSIQADIYALGVIFYEMVHGTRPFFALNGLALAASLMQSSSDNWTYAADAPAPIIQLIRTMTAKLVAQRCATMQHVLIQLRDLQQQAGQSNGLASHGQAMPALTSISKRWNKTSLLSLGLALLLVVSAWQAAPYLSSLSWNDFKPYSESVTMRQGLDALKNFDRPGSLDLANQHFETILKHDVNNAAAVAGLAISYSLRYFSDKQDETWLNLASAAAQRAMSLNDQVALCHVAKAMVLANQGKREEALTVYDRALSLEPANVLAYAGKNSVLLNLNRLDESLQLAQEAHTRLPKERLFLDAIGSVYYKKGDYKNAEASFRQSLEVQPDAIFAYANLSMVLTRLDRKDESLQVLQQGLQIRPSAPLYTALGVALFQGGDYIAAASAFENAVSPTKGNPARYNYWGNLADTLLWIPGRKEEAKSAYQKALELLEPLVVRAPNDAALVSRMGLYLARLGNEKRAPEYLQKAIELAPKNAEVHYRIALAYELLGNRMQALAMIAKAVKLGYPVKNIEAEPDLVELRRDPAYLK